MNQRRILVYGDIDMNVIDGSSIWLQSIAIAFALVPDTSVTLLAKQTIEKRELVTPLEGIPNLTVIDPRSEGISTTALSPFQVRSVVDDDTLGVFDVIAIRGSRIAQEFARSSVSYQNLWVYLTDIPHLAEQLRAEDIGGLQRIVASCGIVLCQTEGLRSVFEDLAPQAAGKTWLLPPMVPQAPSIREPSPISEPIQLVYAGKFAPAWMTLEMCDLPALTAELGVASKVHMVGDKIHRDPEDSTYRQRMEQALLESPGVDWLGRMTRADTLCEVARADIGLAWRSQSLSESLELSTKLLEYGAAGVPFILNRTPDHERLLGSDYPLFAETLEDVASRIADCVSDPEIYARSHAAVTGVAAGFSIEQGAVRLQKIMDRACPRKIGAGTTPHRVLVMSHDFKFFDQLETHLKLDTSLSISRDTWDELATHDPDTSLKLMADAETIICEWCGPNAVFASVNKQEGQRLIVRLHRFELYRDYPRKVVIDAVDAVVAVNDHYRQLIISELGWPEEKVLAIPNWVDVAQLDRGKIGDVRYNLGMIGIAPPTRKRFDRALRILGRLREIDDRYTLFVKSKQPWDYPYMWSDPDERASSLRYVNMLSENDLLNDGVVFDGFGPDVGRWLRKIGFVLSTSDDESFHLSPAEGMASGAVPVVYHWSGAESVYTSQWLHDSENSMVGAIVEATSQEQWLTQSATAFTEIQSIDLLGVAAAWASLIRGEFNQASARWRTPPAIL